MSTMTDKDWYDNLRALHVRRRASEVCIQEARVRARAPGPKRKVHSNWRRALAARRDRWTQVRQVWLMGRNARRRAKHAEPAPAAERRTPEQKYMLLFEALKRSLLILHRVRGRLSKNLRRVEERHHQGLNFEEQAADALIDAISLVDFLHRYGALVDALPLISKRDPAMAKLRAALSDVEAARNYLQHIRGDLVTDAGITYPVLGSVMWSSGIDSYALQFSQTTEANIQVRTRRSPWASRPTVEVEI